MIKQENSFIVLYTDNLQKTANFYTSLGLSIKELDERKCVFQFGTLDVHFNNIEDIPEYAYIYDQRKQSGVLFYIEVENTNTAFEKVKNAGGTIKSQIANRPWDTKEFLFQDPNGYSIVFYEEL